MSTDALQLLIEHWRDDPKRTYQSWFLSEERLKNFRSIRRGLQQVVTEMKAGTFLRNTVQGFIAGNSRQVDCGAAPDF